MRTKIFKIATLISSIVPDCCGVTLGGSRAYDLEDDSSDVEMYFYSSTGIPKLEDINKCLLSIGAKHKRHEEFLWDEYPWGPHSFFEVDGLYYEIGYRIISDIHNKLNNYLEGGVAPVEDCHDLGLGYMYSGLAASVCNEKILLAYDDDIRMLMDVAKEFPEKLMISLKEEYLSTAYNLINGKLYIAAIREDIFFYEIISSRVIRALFVMGFAITKKHFPGDKWNEELLLKTDWENANIFIKILKEHMSLNTGQKGNPLRKWSLIKNAYDIVRGDLE